MNIQIIAVGQKMPGWVDQAFDDYARRMPRQQSVTLTTIATANRKSGDNATQHQQKEADKIRRKIRQGGLLIALDEKGQQWSTRQWADQFRHWSHQYPAVDLLLGGPDGLLPELKSEADQTIALGKMTLPHGLARVVLIEQLYRAWTVTQGHPYHRE